MLVFVSLTAFSPVVAGASSYSNSRVGFWLDEESYLFWGGGRPCKGGCPLLLIAGASDSSYYGDPGPYYSCCQ
jgi:hypothetical protein